MPPFDTKLTTAIDTVAQACRVARAVQQDVQRVRQITKDDRSPVTVADFAVQAIVALELSRHAGPVRIVGEEHAGDLRQEAHAAVLEAVIQAVRTVHADVTADEVIQAIDGCDHDGSAAAYWTLDPIDGTKGFLRGQQYAIALAHIENHRVTHGVMGCPNLPRGHDRPLGEADPDGVIYAAAEGRGTWELTTGGPAAGSRAVHAAVDSGPRIRVCESVEAAHSKQSDTKRILDHLGRHADPVRLDSQCKYAVVARGQADAYLRLPTRRDYVEKIWDHAAGALVATEAGAVVSDVSGAPLDFRHGRRLEANRGVICAVGGLHERIITAIAELGIAAMAREGND